MTDLANIKVTRGNAMRLKSLLHMEYKPTELAQEIGISTDTLYRSYLPAGAPCKVDTKGNIWIIGDQFAKWVMDYSKVNRRKAPKEKMEQGEAYCVACRKVVNLLNAKMQKPNARNIATFTGKCPECGRKVTRFCKASDWQA